MHNSALRIFKDLKGLADGVSLQQQARMVLYASVFRAMVSEVRRLRRRYNVILIEHYRGFFRTFESAKNAEGAESTRIAKNALRGAPRAHLTLYLCAPYTVAFRRHNGRLTEEDFIRMYHQLEALAKSENWHRISVLNRDETDIATECLRAILDRLNAHFAALAAGVN
jgi:sugar phosphate isomerase/epimerase